MNHYMDITIHISWIYTGFDRSSAVNLPCCSTLIRHYFVDSIDKMEFHISALTNLCRVCGSRAHVAKDKNNPVKMCAT